MELAMASNQQRPTDDTEGHVYRWGQDTAAVDEHQVGDDVEGHSAKIRLGQRTEAGDEVEGHGSRFNG